MSKLEPVTISYNGKDYTVDKESSIWGLIEAVEDVITHLELMNCYATRKFPQARIFRAYAAAINYAGGKVTPADVAQVASYVDLGQMVGALISIMALAAPGADVELPEVPEEEGKKKLSVAG